MAKKPHPWYWEARRGWYVLVSGERHFLGDHPADAPKPQRSKKTGKWNSPPVIDQAFRTLLDHGSPPPVEGGDYIGTYLQAFLNWCKDNRAKKTTQRYFDFLDAFERRYHGLQIGDLHAGHVTDWLDEQKGWNSTTKRNAITALQRGFNWACKNKGLQRNPIKGMEKPEAKRRTEVLPPAEFEKLLTHVSPRFKDLLVVSWDSGARPFEVKDLEARHVQADKQRAVIPAEEAKGKRLRVFYFPTARSLEVITRLCTEHPDGPLFRNKRGNKWTGFAVKCAFARLDEQMGRRVTHYSLRHSFVTRKLVAGVDSHIVAALTGHQDTSMIDKVYSHVAEDHAYMLEQAKRDVKPK